MKVHKMVSLDPILAEKASEMDNFSEYVRSCLEGGLAFKHEAYNRRIKWLISVIVIAKDMGSMHPTFKKAVKEIPELWE